MCARGCSRHLLFSIYRGVSGEGGVGKGADASWGCSYGCCAMAGGSVLGDNELQPRRTTRVRERGGEESGRGR